MEIESHKQRWSPASTTTNTQQQQPERMRNIAAFWLLGLINNSAYVVMIAGANQISAASVGLVYMAAVFPGLMVKLTAPFWFHQVSYNTRSIAIATLMTTAYTTVALASSRGWQLLGVVFASLQGGLGEATVLSFTSYFQSGSTVITAWSSGTGFAGIFGYAWVAILHILGGLSFRATLLLANVTSIGWLGVWYMVLEHPSQRAKRASRLASISSTDLFDSDSGGDGSTSIEGGVGGATTGSSDVVVLAASGMTGIGIENDDDDEEEGQRLLPQQQQSATARTTTTTTTRDTNTIYATSQSTTTTNNPHIATMTIPQRIHKVLSLWPYTAPLFLVYYAEYAMQAGVWASIGFPVEDSNARHTYYVFANWCYQVGVFISRSSGTLYQAELPVLWLMPCLQVGWLVFFMMDAVWKFWYNWSLLIPCFCTGLLGGAVYVNAFTLISRQVDPQWKEFSLGAASLSDSLGIFFADFTGILIQGCLFRVNGLSGADFKCFQ